RAHECLLGRVQLPDRSHFSTCDRVPTPGHRRGRRQPNDMFVTAVTVESVLPAEDGNSRRPADGSCETEEVAMPDVAFGAHSRAYRLYDVELPYHIPGLGVGFAISRFKQIGIWDKLPHPIRVRAKAAKGSWSGFKITQKDLDSIPDDAWETIAAKLGIGWRYASASSGCGRDAVAAHG